MTTGKDVLDEYLEITLHASERATWALVALAGFLALCFIAYAVLPRTGESRLAQRIEALKSWLGIPGASRAVTTLVFGLGLIFTALFTIAVIAAFLLIWSVIAGTSADPSTSPTQSLGLGALLVALLSAPFVIWRSVVAQKTVEIAQSQFERDVTNSALEALNAAIEGLSAQEQRDEAEIREDGSVSPVRVTVPDITRRTIAISTLERIARENLDFHVQIMEILCAYVRENSPVEDAVSSVHEVFKRLTSSDEVSQGLSAEDAFRHRDYRASDTFGWNPTELTTDNLKRWAKSLPPLRSDIQAALSVIGRRTADQRKAEKSISDSNTDFRLDLRRTNLQRGRLIGDFEGATFDSARLCGAWLEGEFGESLILDASLRAIEARKANFVQCDFSGATLDASNFLSCDLSRSRFWFSACDRTNFNGSRVRAADFFEATVIHAFFYDYADLSYSRIQQQHLRAFKGLLDGPSRSIFVMAENVEDTDGVDETLYQGDRLTALGLGSELDTRNEWSRQVIEAGLKIGDFSRSYGHDAH